ncbi:hypothetical protein NDI47_17060 [Microcoleus vaginatus GB1-A2]|uniref:hypothetical protein n=1 Tax=Microcoleus vaginatus TaxID=119532 RepID=UPI0032A86716
MLRSNSATATEDGYWPIRKARSSESATIKRLPAVALTAYASEEGRDRPIAADYYEHLTKPIDPALFAAVLGNLTNLH